MEGGRKRRVKNPKCKPIRTPPPTPKRRKVRRTWESDDDSSVEEIPVHAKVVKRPYTELTAAENELRCSNRQGKYNISFNLTFLYYNKH